VAQKNRALDRISPGRSSDSRSIPGRDGVLESAGKKSQAFPRGLVADRCEAATVAYAART